MLPRSLVIKPLPSNRRRLPPNGGRPEPLHSACGRIDGRQEVSRALVELLHKKAGKAGAVFEQTHAGNPVQHCNVRVDSYLRSSSALFDHSEGNTKIFHRVPRPGSAEPSPILSIGTRMHGLVARQPGALQLKKVAGAGSTASDVSPTGSRSRPI